MMTSVAMPLLGPMAQSRNSPSSPARRSSTQVQLQNLPQDKTMPRSQSFSLNRGRSPTNQSIARPPSNSRSPQDRSRPAGGHSSPDSGRKPAETAIKTELPPSPTDKQQPPADEVRQDVRQDARPRPKRLDLSSGGRAPRGPQTAAPMAGRESGLAIKDLGVACLSPGFQTQDPTMREQLQRSLSIREQQRQLIEARQKGGPSAKAINSQDPTDLHRDDGPSYSRAADFDRDPLTARRKGPPAGLSINAPNASAFANERVIQSAPLNQSFTGLRRNTTVYQPSSLGQTSHIHSVAPPANSGNRLPPLSDVFAGDRLESPQTSSAQFRPAYAQPQPSAPIRSPGFPQQQQPAREQPSQSRPMNGPQPPTSSRAREFRSAEEAMQGISGGREEHLPKLVHYGGVQPPTPPSPMQPGTAHAGQAPQQPQQSGGPGPYYGRQEAARHPDYRPEYNRNANGPSRRRTREEYERENGESPMTQQGSFKRHAYEEGDWRAEMSSREKREEFLRLCERAWDLFHS